jgi:light-harvesting complex I chlorophyll a/b binding protein 5
VCVCLLLQGLGKDPEALRWYVQAELVHGRTAMTGVAGILIPAVSNSCLYTACEAWQISSK